jgi:acetylornithine/succinyldiaminopimelate/putrescine aminotransferase
MSLISSTNIIPMPRFGDDHLAHVFSMFPLEVVDAEGVFLNTNDGRRILDLYGGHAVAALGYNHPRWVEALTNQAKSLAFQTNAVHLDVRRRAATRLTEFCGLGCGRGQFPRPHSCCGCNHLGCAEEVVRLSANAF